MDILLQDYLEVYYDTLSTRDQNTFEELLDEADLDILSWIMQKSFPDEKYVGIITAIRESAEISKKPSN
jgi:succinate dehydrogenase flavin-adding protein (antitoxin of CptAB toxin-antitoxin module)